MTVSGSTWIAIMGLTERGFTGHQHVDRLDLIHMNGRTYDTKLGRFMQADIVVQSPFDTQSYNRYSYLMNNPLNGTDPSGYFSLRDLKEYAGVIIGGALLAWHPLGYGIWQSAVYGAIAGGSSAAVNGGNVLQGAAIGAFSAAAFAGWMAPGSAGEPQGCRAAYAQHCRQWRFGGNDNRVAGREVRARVRECGVHGRGGRRDPGGDPDARWKDRRVGHRRRNGERDIGREVCKWGVHGGVSGGGGGGFRSSRRGATW
ncbi:MAG: hypothetical protein IPI75_08320 [Gammaproteobacteria bacterium]|nr:hypothetical protein [Gammaproteobacteria bacterium]